MINLIKILMPSIIIAAVFVLSIWGAYKLLHAKVLWKKCLALFPLLLLYIIVYGLTFGFWQLNIKEVTYESPDIPEAFDGYKIVQVTDVHCGGSFWGPYKGLVKDGFEKINALQPDLICMVGDIQHFLPSELEELKEEIARMRNAHQTPREFGLRVRQDPGALIVTARNKMRTASDITCPVSVSGHLLETPRLKAAPAILAENESVFRSFVNSLADNGRRLNDQDRTKGHYYWEHVPADLVAQLLLDFDTHPWHLSFNGRALSEFISASQWPMNWDVALISGGEGRPFPGGLKCGDTVLQLRSTELRKIEVDSRMLSVSGTKVRVGSGGCTRIGLTSQEIKDAADEFRQATGSVNVSDKAYLTRGRPPILMLHVIDARYFGESSKGLPDFLFALGVGFPKSDHGTEKANYKVNLVELRNWIDLPDETDDDDDGSML